MQNTAIRTESLAALAYPPMLSWQNVKRCYLKYNSRINKTIDLSAQVLTIPGISYVICRSQAQTKVAVRTAITDLTSARPNPKP